MYSDSKSAINIVNNLVQHDWMKHVWIDRHFVKQEMEDGNIKLPYVPTEDQHADILTKAMGKQGFESIRSKLRIFDIYSSAWEGMLEDKDIANPKGLRRYSMDEMRGG